MSGPAPVDRDLETLHIRCGSDLKSTLAGAGFAGDFLEYSDPLCQGPVKDDPAWVLRRASFLASAYGASTGRDAARILADLERAETGLRSAAGRYERIVLWFEHDSYDQLILARCLAQFAVTPPRRLEMVSIDRYPGPVRFIGLGQLPPAALRLLWDERKPVSAGQISAGASVWKLLRSADPSALAELARGGAPALPYMGDALRRHCQELPWVRDGLSLTERLVLQLLAERPRTVGEVFGDLMSEREPLPWLGDIMFRFVVESMKAARQPVFTGAFDGEERRWAAERLTITNLGYEVLAGNVDWISLAPPERWLGGVHIGTGGPCWRWNENGATTDMR